ncbi:MAG: DUF4332 domain-containing protein [Luteolibacter sp.]
MIRIGRIEGIDDDLLALLEAAGFQNASSLARVGPNALHRELSRANELLRIAPSVPEVSRLRDLIDAAQKISGINDAAHASNGVSEAPAVLKVERLLESAPVAMSLPARMMIQNKLGVADVPEALPMDEIACYLGADRMIESALVKSGGGNVRLADANATKLDIDTSRVRSIEEFADPSAQSVDHSSDEVDRITLLRSPRKESNEGVDPNSRHYLRGILHKNPVRIYLGALVTLRMMLSIPVAVASALLLLASTNTPKYFAWVPSWLIVFPLILPLIALGYAVFGNICSCRVCCQKLFVPKTHLKSPRAHHVKVLGYILPLCVHIVLFRWFRCTHCGTPIRLKE